MGIHMECPAPPPAPRIMNLYHDPARFCLLILLLVPPVTAQFQNSPPSPSQLDPFTRLRFDKTMAAVLVILVVVFFALGFVSIYTRQCAERRIRGRLDLAVAIAGGMDRRQHHGLDRATVDTFPTFVYSEVKALKIGKATLECAVCLNEFRDDETLRLIPKCCHVFHPDCIDAWLVNHSTCPVCRANLSPKPEDALPPVEIHIPDSARPNGPNAEPDYDPNYINPVREGEGEGERNRIVTEPISLDDPNRVRPVRSRSTGFGVSRLFPRSHSTGHSLVRPGADCERFTLRLPEDVRNQLMSSGTLNRTKSCGVTWERQSSGRRGYRTRSVGRSYLRYERFGGDGRLDRWGFMWTPPFWGRTGSGRSAKSTKMKDEVDVGERSSDLLFTRD
ncbi:RING-H2 finger protein ATL11-like [Vigna radiata var. radiata]|uniref:RING-type E3 ubiquitin transferase n=1 Tax=Vigna radiata var. radiata TaxID=3916 RepID=A0A1S3TFA7_VIGRR|nr:RING-H2 finger protein ATL11-like [Vigna radiata var. radiata]